VINAGTEWAKAGTGRALVRKMRTKNELGWINPDRMECDTRIFSIMQRYPGYKSLAQVLPPLMGNLFSLERRMKAADTDHRRMKKLFDQGYSR